MMKYLDSELEKHIIEWVATCAPHAKSKMSVKESPKLSVVDTGLNNGIELAIPVIGHDPKNIDVTITEDSIKITAVKGDVKGVLNQLCSDISETITLPKYLDGLTSKAEIKNGILIITIGTKETHTPKKLSIKF